MILFGASGHAKVILDILFLTGSDVEYIIDNNPKSENLFGIPVKKEYQDTTIKSSALIAIGNNNIRKKIADANDLIYETAIHPSSVVSRFSNVESGTVVMAGVVINPSVSVGKHCILNTGSVIDHDCIIEDFVHISPNASLAGNVLIGEGSQVGIGASIIQGVRVGKWCTIGAGAVIIKDVPDYAVVVGNPGKIIKYNVPNNQ